MNPPPLSLLNAGQNYRVRGGSDRYMIELEKLLLSAGHKVIPFAARHSENLSTPWSIYFPEPVDFQNPSPRDLMRFIYSPSAVGCLRRLLGDHTIDLAHLHIYYGQLTGAILKPLKERNIPIVQTLHEYKVVCPVYTLTSNGQPCERCSRGHLWHAVARRCNRNSFGRSLLSTIESTATRLLGSVHNVDRFIAVSRFQKDVLIRMGLPPEKVEVVHNFIDPASYPSADRPSSQDYVLYFGRVERIKGIFTLLEAMTELPEIPLKIAGDGSALIDARRYIEELGLKNVQLLGFQQGRALARTISGALCTVLPAQWYETFGLTSLEAYRYEKPVIASRIGGIPEVVLHGSTGRLVEPGNASALAKAIRAMANDPQRAAEMGSAGHRLLHERFSPHTHLARILEVYTSVLSDNVSS